jgi:hypothetical protein
MVECVAKCTGPGGSGLRDGAKCGEWAEGAGTSNAVRGECVLQSDRGTHCQ